jgi:hypothetical protein
MDLPDEYGAGAAGTRNRHGLLNWITLPGDGGFSPRNAFQFTQRYGVDEAASVGCLFNPLSPAMRQIVA